MNVVSNGAKNCAVLEIDRHPQPDAKSVRASKWTPMFAAIDEEKSEKLETTTR
jgi:hypothetical protein